MGKGVYDTPSTGTKNIGKKLNNIERAEKQDTTIFYNPERKRKIEERQKQYYGLVPPSNASTAAFDGSNDMNFDPNTPEHLKMSECQLKGPFHPLEFKLTSAHQVGGQRIVHVEPESVNSVLLDDHPEDTIDQFLVAAHVGMNPTGNALMARSSS